MSEISNTYLIISDQVHRIIRPVTKIGRSLDNHLVISDTSVSRLHAEIRFEMGKFQLVDMGSTGGSFHNGERVEKCTLQSGDSIQLADVPLIFAQNKTNLSNDSFEQELELSQLGPDENATLIQNPLDWRIQRSVR